jgi:hypothetical protein
MIPQSKGVVHWSISSLTNNPRMADTLLKSVYKKQALVPSSSWLDHNAPVAPTVTTTMQENICKISWTHSSEADVFHWIVYFQYGNNWNYQVLNRNDRSLEIKRITGTGASLQQLKKIIVTAVDRTGNESEKKEMELK